ncbi:MAG: hypothetical protein WEB88_13035 [Gemmatimonadota bacterium]
MRPFLSKRSPALAVCLVLAACAGGDPGPTPTAVRDSAGIRIIDNGAPAWTDGQVWRIAPEPEVVIGHAGDARYEFERVQGMTRLADGTIVVLNTGARELRFYDAAGVYLRTVGREGRGPGEFRYPRHFLVRGDTLLVWDDVADELTRLLPDGTQLDRVSLRHPEVWTIAERRQAEGPLNLVTVFSSLLPDARVLTYLPGTTSDPGSAPTGTDRWGVIYFLFDPDERVVTDLGTYYGPAGGDGGGLGRSPSGASQFANVLHAFHAAPFRLAIGGTERYDITVLGVTGAPVQRIRRNTPARPILDADRDAILSAREAELLALGLSPTDAHQYARPPRGQVFPYFDAMVYDHAGHLWVRDNAMLWDTTATWRVFGADGIYLGPVQAPAQLNVLEIGPDYLLGLVRDTLGVETVHLHRLQRN